MSTNMFSENLFGGSEVFDVFTAARAYFPNDTFIKNIVFNSWVENDRAYLEGVIYQLFTDKKSGLKGIKSELSGRIVYNVLTRNIEENTLTELLRDCVKRAYNEIAKEDDFWSKQALYFNLVNGTGIACAFATRVLKERSPYAYKTVRNIKGIFNADFDKMSCMGVSNILSLFIDYPNEMEKMLKVSPRTIKDGWETVSVDGLISTKKTKVPNAVLAWANKQQEPSKLLNVLQSICNHEDANNAVIFQDFVNQLKRLKCLYCGRWKGDIGSFYDGFARIIDYDCGYTTKKLIDYLIRQNYFYGDFEGPYEEMSNLLDYIELALGAGLEFERWPTDVFKAHNIMTRNVTALELTPEEEKSFEDYNASMAKKYEIKMDGYVVVLPKTVAELVKEGNDLNHCVAGYSRRIAEKKTLVGFLRLETAPNESLYTIEISKNKVIQAKGACNEDVPQKVMDIINKMERSWGR